MKYSQYLMCGKWDNPHSYCGPTPIRWNMEGKPTHFTTQPAVISVHKTDETSMAHGFIICARLMEITPPELN